MYITAGHHFNIDTRLNGLISGLRLILGNTMRNQFLHRTPIRDHDSVKSPFLAKQIPHQLSVAAGRNSIHGVEGGHHHFAAFIQRGLVGRQIVFTKLTF
ncbi:hypothetical protein D3C81_672590 [compost metagenome]